jgi:DNA-binding transcriptional LysR family regulator
MRDSRVPVGVSAQFLIFNGSINAQNIRNFSQKASDLCADLKNPPNPFSHAALPANVASVPQWLKYRTTPHIQLTGLGKVLEEKARNIIAQVENAKSRIYSASKGFKRQLRIGLPDGLIPPQLAQLLARSREEEPATEIRIHNMAFHELYPTLRRGQIDAGFTLDVRDNPEGVTKIKTWRERPVVALPIRRPPLFCKKSPFTRHCIIH